MGGMGWGLGQAWRGAVECQARSGAGIGWGARREASGRARLGAAWLCVGQGGGRAGGWDFGPAGRSARERPCRAEVRGAAAGAPSGALGRVQKHRLDGPS